VEAVLEAGTRSARIVAQVANPGRKFRPGMSANVSAVLSERPNAMTIPSEAVFGSGDQSFVFVVKSDSTVSRVPLKLGARLSTFVEVLGGLTPGMTVVRAGHQKLFEGARVMPVSSQGEGAPKSSDAKSEG
jgi:membrane fusion protein (multidrug efflux system)